jgi:molybdenum cofactor biosynthesis protein B
VISQAAHEHKEHAPRQAGCVVITCSDTRTAASDTSGYRIMHMLKDAGHSVLSYQLVKDEPSKIKAAIKKAVKNKKAQAIIINGGTGIAKRDSTFEAIEDLLEKKLDGFGEVFRALTYQEIGSPAIMTRATAGTYKGRILFSTPGSENAVKLAMEKLILPELGHILQQLSK